MGSSGVMSVDEPLTITGSDFNPGEPVTLALVIDNIVSYVVGGRTAEQPVANAAGAFSVSYDSIRGGGGGERGALGRAPGIRTIRAEGEDGSRASFPVMITSANAPEDCASCSLSVSSQTAVIPPKADAEEPMTNVEVQIEVMGAGFAPNEDILLTVIAFTLDADTPGADKVLVGGRANDSGAFVIEHTLAGGGAAPGTSSDDLPMPVLAGVYTVLAEGAGGSAATAALVVENPK